MKTLIIEKGFKVKTKFNEIVSIIDIIENMVRVYEDSLNLYHVSNLYFEGISLSNYNIIINN